MFIDDDTRVRHMLDSARESVRFAATRQRSDLDSDRLLTLGLLKCVETVGEAAYRITRNYRDAHPQIDWEALIAMRHSLVHDYHAVDLDALWNTVTVDLPALIPSLEQIVP